MEIEEKIDALLNEQCKGKAAPLPNSDSTEIFPPKATIFFTVANQFQFLLIQIDLQ
jgi:hypothetical protein